MYAQPHANVLARRNQAAARHAAAQRRVNADKISRVAQSATQ